MDGISIDVKLSDFQAALTPAFVRTLQIIHIAMAAGILFFGGVVFFLFLKPTSSANNSTTTILPILSLVNVCMASVNFFLASLLYNKQFGHRAFSSTQNDDSMKNIGLDPSNPGARCAIMIQKAMIIRLALFEGAAFFGLVVCLLGATTGTIKQSPIYWLNLIPALVLILTIMRTFPTAERLEEIFRDKISSAY